DNTAGEALPGIQRKLPGQYGLHDGVAAGGGLDECVLVIAGITKQFPIAPLHLTITRSQPGLEAEGLIIKDDSELEIAPLQLIRKKREVGHVEIALVQS